MSTHINNLTTSWWEGLWPCYSCCHQIWISSLATFSPQCLGLIGHIPLWISLLTVTIRYGAVPFWSQHRPIWLRKFSAEEHVKALPDDVDQEIGGSTVVARKPWSSWTVFLSVLTLLTAVLGAVGTTTSSDMAQLFLIPVVPSIVSSIVLLLERPRTAPRAVLVIQGTTLLVTSMLYIVVPNITGSGWSQGLAWASGIGLPLLSVAVILNMPLRDPHMDATGIGKPFAESNSSLTSPEDLITLWQWMTVSWIAPVLRVARRKQLEPEDVWLLGAEFQHKRLHLLFRELKGSVLQRLLQANGLDLIIVTFLAIIRTALDLAEPLLLKQLLGAFTSESDNDHNNHRTVITYTSIVFIARLVKAQLQVFILWISRRAYERCRGELFTMIYEKALRRKAFTSSPGEASTPTTEQDHARTEDNALGSEDTAVDSEDVSSTTTLTDDGGSQRNTTREQHTPADAPASTGKILSIIQGDVYGVAQRFWDIADLTTKPLTFLLSAFLVWRFLGLAALSGIGILVACIVANAWLIRLKMDLETERRAITDVKQERTSQFVESIRHLRWYAWQNTWLARIMETRQKELKKRLTVALLDKAIKNVSIFGGYLFPVVAFWAYTVFSQNPLTIDIAFPALDLFDMLQKSLNDLPGLIDTLVNANISMKRIEAFMQEPDKEGEDWKPSNDANTADGPQGKLEVSMSNASFSWPQSQRCVLEDVSLFCGAGLTMVCGQVGIGKSALLQSILGELDQCGGERMVPREMIAYCAQTPWLESMSIRDNILFSGGYDPTRYEHVIDACCLREDFNLFKSKDMTMIGENGVGLSGGQKARVALARAVYSRARILLLDDPIAALDHQTASSVVKNLFSSKYSFLTEGRLTIFVTHRVDIIKPYAYQVIEVGEHGRAQTLGVNDLENNERFRHLAAIAESQEAEAEEIEAGITCSDEDEESKPEDMIQKEGRAHGGVVASIYWQFIKAGRLHWWVAIVALFALYRILKIGFFWFVKEWGDAYGEKSAGLQSIHAVGFGYDAQDLQHKATAQHIYQVSGKGWFEQHLPSPDQNAMPWLWWFLFFTLAQFFASAAGDVVNTIIAYTTGKNIFAEAITRVANVTFRYYDITPVGRLMNRLINDMGSIDGGISGMILDVSNAALGWTASIAVIAAVTPLFLLVSFLMSWLFVQVFRHYLPASQALRRLETVGLSPMFSNFSNLINGLTTIRAFRAQPHFQAQNIVDVDGFQRMDHFYWSVQTWLAYRYIILSAFTTFTLTLTAIVSGLSSGVIAFVLASASNFVRSTQSLCQSYGALQMSFVSVERIFELLREEEEPRGTVVPPAAWPVYGDDIVFDNVSIKYTPTSESVLKNITFTIPGGSNVAITGRTGSGKTTLVQTLLSTLQPETGGTIHIGPVDLATVDKHALRSNITFVAQDPVLFSGTLRDNLDPTNEKTDEECATVLQQVFGGGLTNFTINTELDGGGRCISQGQRQLIGLARAILRRSPVVIMDEATASIDHLTAAKIHRLLREELKYSTVITIAHRVEAVTDADFEIVLDRGRVVRACRREVP
ncbi:hypothetical protein QBC38DRAFT_219190 [Podospora fimiseda]|uniref:ABC transporter n=1 Tax=Podospora fimiseda TaxID=252190 RepID=A0AAN7BNQ0_9PEZI|nr:hypothetical protein QBC38DRAFT_219190 [Podospora fimiseda]